MAARLPALRVCTGGDCREARKALAALKDAVHGRCAVEEVGCQKICEGPVCGLELDGELEWFAQVDSERAREALVAALDQAQRGAVTADDVGHSLWKRRVKKRRGRLR